MEADTADPLGLTGTTVAEKYLVESVVGEGGHAIVYKATHTLWKTPVALKCFRALSHAPEELRDRLLREFLQEGQLLARLSTRTAAIVQARDVGTLTTRDGAWIPYMVLEWLDGTPLDLVLTLEAERGLPPRTILEVVELLDSAIAGIALAHREGIAHRDIKPENLIVVGDARKPGAIVKVVDFGIAKVMAGECGTELLQTGTAITPFTPYYGAPEQFSRSHGATGPWTDVFAMALVVIEIMRGGARAYEGDDYIEHARASRDPARRPTPRALGLEVSDAVEAVFLRALAVSPAERYRTMGDFWAALSSAVRPDEGDWTASAHYAESPTGQAPGVGRPGSGTPPAVSRPSSSATLPAPRRSARSAWTAALAGGLVVAGAATIAFFSLRDGGDTSPEAGGELSAAVAALGASEAMAAASAPVSPAPAPTCREGTALVPGGRFFMGSDDAAFKLWQPAHRVSVDAFCIDIHEVTVGAYRGCVDDGACRVPADLPDYPKTGNVTDDEHLARRRDQAELCNWGKPDRDAHPINCVTWEQADAYCRFAKQRLPTEAEWEYAARGSDGRTFPWGDESPDAGFMNACGTECNAWERAHGLPPSDTMYEEDDGYAGTAPVGSFPKGLTRFGAFDMVGNVWEWTGDWFATYSSAELVNPKGAPAGDRKAIRGGGFNGGVELWHNPAFRYHQLATASAPGIGFRCVQPLE